MLSNPDIVARRTMHPRSYRNRDFKYVALALTAALTAAAIFPKSAAFAEPPRRKPNIATPIIVDRSSDHVSITSVQPEMSPEATPTKFDRTLFGPDPTYPDKPYDTDAQYQIYGGKTEVLGPRPPIELGYPMYQSGDIGAGSTIFGSKNPARPQLLVYGDWRVGTAYNNVGDFDTAQAATRLNLDVDFRITATERIHGFFRPFDRVVDPQQTRVEFGGSHRSKPGGHSDFLFDGGPESLFFEGDAGQIWSGISGEYNKLDLPFAVGLTPIFLQNGIWMDDSILGGAFTIPALNSPTLDISNMDFTFFSGLDKVTTKAIVNDEQQLDDHGARLYGVAGFFETRDSYIETGYGYTEDRRDNDGADFGYHSATAAITRRYANYVSNSIRLIVSAGQDVNNGRTETADGWVLLIENSLITSKPYTVLPYGNFFVGHDRPQSLARDFAAQGVLKNTGINFETDGLTGFPKLEDSANDTYGGAVGIQYLFNLDQQLVFELAGLDPMGSGKFEGRAAKGAQGAFGIRYQIPLSRSLIFRTDAMYGVREHEDDLSGVRAELRLKF